MTGKIIADKYLGDGVYASFDGYYIVLDLRGQDTTTKIVMEPKVVGAFKRYQEALSLRLERLQQEREAVNDG